MNGPPIKGHIPQTVDDRRMSPPKSLTADGVLAHMFRTIMFERGITFQSMPAVVGRFLARYEIPDTAVSQDRRANLMKELRADTMSWRSFVRNQSLIGIGEFELVIRARGLDGRTTEHSIMVTPSVHDTLNEVGK